VLADVAAQFTLFLATAGVVVAAYAVVVPAIRQARDLELSTSTAVVRMSRYVVAFAALLTVLFVPFRRLLAGGGLSLAPVVLVVFVVALPVVSPFLLRVLRNVRRPTPDERERLERACDRVGLDVADVGVLADADEVLEIHVRGLSGRRRLFVSEFALTALDDATLEALLAVNAGQVEANYRAIKAYPLLGFIIIAVAAFVWGTAVSYAVVIGLALLLPLPVQWAGRRAVRRGDEYAADRVGPAVVADALERSATVQNVEIPSGGLSQLLKSRPALGARIDRLRDDDDPQTVAETSNS
jgi:hypothetical protein